mgnify:CR=1 FL=1
MSEFISESDRERITEFLKAPPYERDPELLVPEEE